MGRTPCLKYAESTIQLLLCEPLMSSHIRNRSDCNADIHIQLL